MNESKRSSEEVTTSISSLAQGANEVASNIQTVSAAMDKSSKGIRQVSSSSDELSPLAADLNTLAHRFKLGANVAG